MSKGFVQFFREWRKRRYEVAFREYEALHVSIIQCLDENSLLKKDLQKNTSGAAVALARVENNEKALAKLLIRKDQLKKKWGLG